MSKKYRLFMSHSWVYGDAYDKLITLLEDQNLSFCDYSVSKDDPVHRNGTDKQLKEVIEYKMKETNCILILAGVYANYSKWIQKEIHIAASQGKSIIVIEPWSSEKTSVLVRDSSDLVVKWQGKSIVNAIKKLS